MVKGSCFVLGTSTSFTITFVNMLHIQEKFFIKVNCFLIETETLKQWGMDEHNSEGFPDAGLKNMASQRRVPSLLHLFLQLSLESVSVHNVTSYFRDVLITEFSYMKDLHYYLFT